MEKKHIFDANLMDSKTAVNLMLVLLIFYVAKCLLTIIFFVGLAGEGGVCTAIVSLINTECKAVTARTGGYAWFFKNGLNSKVGYLFIIKNINPTYE